MAFVNVVERNLLYNFGIQSFWSLVWIFGANVGQTRLSETGQAAPRRHALALQRVALARVRERILMSPRGGWIGVGAEYGPDTNQ
jgi:hypothetical protein